MTIASRMLLAVLSVLGCLSILRTYHLWVTGFFISDEYGYIYYAMHNPAGSPIYAYRYFIALFNEYFFRVFDITSVDKFLFLLPFYLSFWSGLTTFLYFKIMKNLEFDERTIALSIISSIFLITFVLFSLGFLTEPAGLSMTMLGIFFLVKFAKVKSKPKLLLAYPLLAALSFVAAAYTREPYSIFVIGGILPVFLIALSHRNTLHVSGRAKKRALLVMSVLLFTFPGLFFVNSRQFTSTGLVSLTDDFVGTISDPFSQGNSTFQATTPSPTQTMSSVSRTAMNTTSNVIASSSNTETSSTSKTTIIGTTESVSATSQTSSQTTTPSTPSVTIATSTTTTSSSTMSPPQVSAAAYSPMVRTFLIFFLGLVLGWGPVLFAIALIGLAALISPHSHKKGSLRSSVVTLSFLAYCSYFFVSYFLSAYPDYLTSLRYSTLIRFSNTALPAYFLTAPFALSLIARKRKLVISFIAILLIFVVAAVPAYQTYSTTALGLEQNPFSFDYKSPATPGVIIRDYVIGHQNDEPFYVMGFPEDAWWWVPGNTGIRSVYFFPYLSQAEFLDHRWSTFYIWGISSNAILNQVPYLSGIVNTNTQHTNSSEHSPYILVNRNVIFNGSHLFIKVQLSWMNDSQTVKES